MAKGFTGGSDSNQPAMQETQVRSLSQEDPLEKGMATHSSLLVWRILWTKEPGWLQSIESQKVRHNRASDTFTFMAKNMLNFSIFLWTLEIIFLLCNLMLNVPILSLINFNRKSHKQTFVFMIYEKMKLFCFLSHVIVFKIFQFILNIFISFDNDIYEIQLNKL